MKNKLTKTMLCGAMAFACAIGGAALLKNDGNVTASAATGTEFAMVDGAAVRLAADGKYGIRYTASLGVANETDLAKYDGKDFYVMIIPEDYITKYNLTASTDLYGDLYTALYDAETNPNPYIATMNALPFNVTDAEEAAQLGLNVNEYYVRGSLTTVQYENLNRDFFGIAYYQDAEGNRTYAAYDDNVRNLVNVSSKALNSGAYVDDTEKTDDNWDILRGFVKKGVQSASEGTTNVLDETGAEAALSSITIQSEVKTLDKAETTVSVNMTALPEGVDIDVAWATAENETVIEEVQDGTIVPKNWGETTVTAKVLGVSTSIAVKSYKADDWTFDIDEGYEQYYDFVQGTATDDLTSGNFSSYGNAGAISIADGYLKLTNVPNWSATVLMNESKLGSYNVGDTVYTQIRMKAIDSTTGADVSWDRLMMYAFTGKNVFPTLEGESATKDGYTLTISGEDDEGFKTLTWYAPVADYWQGASTGTTVEDATLEGYEKTAKNFALMFGSGWGPTSGAYATTLLIDWIKTDTVATECTGSVNGAIATSTTYGGRTNANYVSTTATVEGVDASTLTLGSRDTAVALAGANGTVTGGSTAGSASITVNSAEGDKIVYGSLGTVDVYTAINCKYDLDMLALAYALGVNETAWSTSAKYMLTQDIDYNGALFIPIAANNGRGCTTARAIGRQWETVLADETTYGLSYADFVKKGLNGVWTEDFTDAIRFNATLDGNGHAVKNAKLMLDACIGTNGGSAAGFATNFIGLMGLNGVLKNISIENLTMQTLTEAGYSLGEQNIVRPVVGADITTSGYTTWTHTIAANAYYMTCVGVFGCGGGTLENVYAEWNANLPDATFSNRVLENYAFGRWDRKTSMTDCLFVDNFTSLSGGATYYSICVSSSGSMTADNVIVVSSHDKYGSGTTTGTYTEYTGLEALQTAYTADNTLFNGFGDWTITLQNNELTCDITNGIAG